MHLEIKIKKKLSLSLGRKSSRILSQKVIFSVSYKGKLQKILCTLHITLLAWLEEHHSGEP